MANNFDLGTIFQAVTQQLTENKDALNQADTNNHDHGDNMVEIFSLVQKAVGKKSDKPISEQLDYASQMVEKEIDSGSGQLYAQGLSNAAKNLKDTDLNEKSIGTLIQSLLGVENSAPVEEESSTSQGNLLGSLLSGLSGSGSTGQQSQGDALGSLLSSLTGGGSSSQESQGGLLGSLLSGATGGETSDQPQEQKIGFDQLLQAGMAYYSSKQSGGSEVQAILQAVMAASPMSNSAHRSQSGTLVASTIMNLAKNLGK